MTRRHALSLALLALAAVPAMAQDAETLRLACRADTPSLLPAPLAFSIDLAAKEASETASGERFGVDAAGDSLVLRDRGGQPVFRIDRITGRFARVDKQLRLEGMCDKAERKF